ncbi:hypothetical protein [Arthrobacter sp.]|uniref:hypothetical protein n=1 Tax=Arthrobacter sp. TaxID=1667 RepID=UPI003A8CD1BF
MGHLESRQLRGSGVEQFPGQPDAEFARAVDPGAAAVALRRSVLLPSGRARRW